jgi:hypothetical protein
LAESFGAAGGFHGYHGWGGEKGRIKGIARIADKTVGEIPELANQSRARSFFAPGGIPAAVWPAAITLRSTATDGDEIG